MIGPILVTGDPRPPPPPPTPPAAMVTLSAVLAGLHSLLALASSIPTVHFQRAAKGSVFGFKSELAIPLPRAVQGSWDKISVPSQGLQGLLPPRPTPASRSRTPLTQGVPAFWTLPPRFAHVFLCSIHTLRSPVCPSHLKHLSVPTQSYSTLNPLNFPLSASLLSVFPAGLQRAHSRDFVYSIQRS